MRTGKFYANNKGVDPNPEDERALTPKPGIRSSGGNDTWIRYIMIGLFGAGLLFMCIIFTNVYSARGFGGLIEFIKLIWF